MKKSEKDIIQKQQFTTTLKRPTVKQETSPVAFNLTKQEEIVKKEKYT